MATIGSNTQTRHAMGWMILKDATETHGVLYWGDTPQDFVDMLWHHSKAHVSPAMFKRTIAMNNLCELIRADTPTCGGPGP